MGAEIKSKMYLMRNPKIIRENEFSGKAFKTTGRKLSVWECIYSSFNKKTTNNMTKSEKYVTQVPESVV